jgi:cbb3-type cytochrome oxidase subunit 1
MSERRGKEKEGFDKPADKKGSTAWKATTALLVLGLVVLSFSVYLMCEVEGSLQSIHRMERRLGVSGAWGEGAMDTIPETLLSWGGFLLSLLLIVPALVWRSRLKRSSARGKAVPPRRTS